jgi:glycosyltransferase involved in cell wall biosynthesis
MNQHNPLEQRERPSLTLDLHDGTNEQVSIIVVHHNRPEYLNICLQSIHVMSNLNNYETIVVDNGSDQETQDYLDVLQDEGIKVVRNEKNEYWSKAANQGVAVADANSRYLVFMHCDTVVLDQSWLDVLVNTSVSNDAGIVGIEMQSYWIAKQKVDFVQEYCMLMTRQCWEDCGPWPEELPLVGNSFIMTLRSQVRGHKPISIANKLVHHYKAFILDPNKFEQISSDSMGILPKLMQQAQKR